MAEPAIRFDAVDIIFGELPGQALPLVDQGKSREEILSATGQVLGVAGATLGIERGETCVLMGLSGSGKSTLLRAVNRLNQPVRGSVTVSDGERAIEVGSADARTLRYLRTTRVAMVFQQFGLLPWRTVAENVGFGLELRGVKRGERDRIVAEKLALVHLDAWAEKRVHELSGGMQQRVGLARALATDADILLMDEPFSALDPLIRMRLQDELIELQKSLGKTIVFVSHDLEEALKLGTKIAIMEGGRIVQVGTPEVIVTEPATEYVRDFVANVNPLSVLTAASTLTPLDRLVAVDGGRRRRWLDQALRLRLETDEAGRLVSLDEAGRHLQASPYDGDSDMPAPADGLVVSVAPETPVRVVVAAVQATGRPVLVVDPEGRIAGRVGVTEILGCLGQPRD